VDWAWVGGAQEDGGDEGEEDEEGAGAEDDGRFVVKAFGAFTACWLLGMAVLVSADGGGGGGLL
jgi:hypothetical protein